MESEATLHSGKAGRSRRETICLRVVLGIYAAILVLAGIFWRATCIFLYIIAATRLTCAILVLREKRQLPDANDVLPGSL